MQKEVICGKVRYPDGSIVYEDLEAFRANPTPGAEIVEEAPPVCHQQQGNYTNAAFNRSIKPVVGQVIGIELSPSDWKTLHYMKLYGSSDHRIGVNCPELGMRIQALITGLLTSPFVRAIITKIEAL